MKNWKTTIGGVISAAATGVFGAHASGMAVPEWLLIAATIANPIGLVLMGGFARDLNVTSEGRKLPIQRA